MSEKALKMLCCETPALLTIENIEQPLHTVNKRTTSTNHSHDALLHFEHEACQDNHK